MVGRYFWWGAFGIADDEAQMAEVVVIAPCWNAGRRLLKFLERFGKTRSRWGGCPGSFIRVINLVGRIGAAPRVWPKTASGFMLVFQSAKTGSTDGGVAARRVIDRRFDPEKCDRLDGSIWSGLSGKGLDRRSNVVERNGRFGRLKMCRFFLRVTSENPRQTGVRCEPKWGEHGWWKRCIT